MSTAADNSATPFEETPVFTARVQAALARLTAEANAAAEALQFVWDARGDLNKLREELEETELILENRGNDPWLVPNASPRLYKEAYAVALRKALRTVESGGDVPTAE